VLKIGQKVRFYPESQTWKEGVDNERWMLLYMQGYTNWTCPNCSLVVCPSRTFYISTIQS
jgi:hypothetical protein